MEMRIELFFLAAFLFLLQSVPSIQGSDIAYQDALDMIQGLSGWTIDIQGVKYFCYSYLKEKCRRIIGRGNWEIITETQKGRIPGGWLIDREDAKIFCKAQDKSECRSKRRNYWKTVLDWKDKNSSGEDKPPRPTPPGPQETIDRRDALDLIQGFKWRIIMDGIEYFCYSFTVQRCKVTFGGDHWKLMPKTKNLLGPFLIDGKDAKLFCNARIMSKCRSYSEMPYTLVRNWDEEYKPEEEPSTTTISPPGGTEVIDRNDALDIIQGLDKWSITMDGIEFFCYAISVSICRESFGGHHWKHMPKSKNVPGPFLVDKGNAKIICNAQDKSRCMSNGRIPWAYIRNWDARAQTGGDEVIDKRYVQDLIQGTNKWSITLDNIEYFCYTISVSICKKTFGGHYWKHMPKSKNVPGPFLIDGPDAKIICNARDKSECKSNGEISYRTIQNWDARDQTGGDEAIDQNDAQNLIQWMDTWSIIMDDIEYFCFAISVSKCKESFGGHYWKHKPKSKNIPGRFLIDGTDAKIICNARDKSRCNSKGEIPWAEIRGWDARNQDEAGSTSRGDGAVDRNDASDMIQGLYEWSIIIDGIEYLCYSISVNKCENLVDGGRWKRTSISQNDYHHVPSPFLVDGSDAKMFCKARNKSQCESVGDIPWTWVRDWDGGSQTATVRPPDYDNPNKTVRASDALKLTQGLEGWTGWDLKGSQYFCYSFSSDTCKKTIADGEWIPIQKSDKIGGQGPVMFNDRNNAKLFCKPLNNSRCVSKDHKQWSYVLDWTDNNPVEKPWIVDANYSALVKKTVLFCKAPSESDCPLLPPDADSLWTDSNGNGAQAFFRGFPEFRLDEELYDAHCPMMAGS